MNNSVQLTQQDVDEVERLTTRQIQNIQYLNNGSISIDSLKFTNPDEFLKRIRRIYKTQLLRNDLIRIDNELINSVEKCIADHTEPTQDIYKLLEDLESIIKEAAAEGIFFQKYNLDYVDGLRQKLGDHKIALDNESYLSSVVDNDSQISKYVCLLCSSMHMAECMA